MATSRKQERSIPLAYAERYREFAPALPGADLPWLKTLRQEAIARFSALGLPSPRVEAWKYTNLSTLAKQPFVPVDGADIAVSPADVAALLPPEDGPSYRMVFVNGRLRPELSAVGELPPNVRLCGLAQALTDEPAQLEPHLGRVAALNGHALVALNTAFMEDGCLIQVPRDEALEAPIHLIFLGRPGATPPAYHPRIVVIAELGSRVTLIESHVGAGQGVYWSNPVTEIRAEPGAVVGHYKFQDEGPGAYHIARTDVALAAGSRYESFVMAVGAGLSRNEIRVALGGEGADCRLFGGYMMRGRQHVDNTTRIDHLVPGCTSRETYTGVLDNRSRGVFQGQIVVHKGAQKSDGRQLSRTLLLSREAEIDTKPELEIYADDVTCSHGAAVGELDDDQLFYLRTRGIDEAAARGLLIEGFMGELADEIGFAPARDRMLATVSAWLSERREQAA